MSTQPLSIAENENSLQYSLSNMLTSFNNHIKELGFSVSTHKGVDGLLFKNDKLAQITENFLDKHKNTKYCFMINPDELAIYNGLTKQRIESSIGKTIKNVKKFLDEEGLKLKTTIFCNNYNIHWTFLEIIFYKENNKFYADIIHYDSLSPKNNSTNLFESKPELKEVFIENGLDINLIKSPVDKIIQFDGSSCGLISTESSILRLLGTKLKNEYEPLSIEERLAHGALFLKTYVEQAKTHKCNPENDEVPYKYLLKDIIGTLIASKNDGNYLNTSQKFKDQYENILKLLEQERINLKNRKAIFKDEMEKINGNDLPYDYYALNLIERTSLDNLVNIYYVNYLINIIDTRINNNIVKDEYLLSKFEAEKKKVYEKINIYSQNIFLQIKEITEGPMTKSYLGNLVNYYKLSQKIIDQPNVTINEGVNISNVVTNNNISDNSNTQENTGSFLGKPFYFIIDIFKSLITFITNIFNSLVNFGVNMLTSLGIIKATEPQTPALSSCREESFNTEHENAQYRDMISNQSQTKSKQNSL